ncbi:hypothetical protein ACFE04_016429 [Oxalis oulophora]
MGSISNSDTFTLSVKLKYFSRQINVACLLIGEYHMNTFGWDNKHVGARILLSKAPGVDAGVGAVGDAAAAATTQEIFLVKYMLIMYWLYIQYEGKRINRRKTIACTI